MLNKTILQLIPSSFPANFFEIIVLSAYNNFQACDFQGVENHPLDIFLLLYKKILNKNNN